MNRVSGFFTLMLGAFCFAFSHSAVANFSSLPDNSFAEKSSIKGQVPSRLIVHFEDSGEEHYINAVKMSRGREFLNLLQENTETGEMETILTMYVSNLFKLELALAGFSEFTNSEEGSLGTLIVVPEGVKAIVLTSGLRPRSILPQNIERTRAFEARLLKFYVYQGGQDPAQQAAQYAEVDKHDLYCIATEPERDPNPSRWVRVRDYMTGRACN